MGRSWSSALRDPRVTAALASGAMVSEVLHRASVASTQDEALELLRQGARSGLMLVTDHQSAGRGRRGRSWDDSPQAGASLAFTLVIDTPRFGVTLVPHVIGLALHDAITAQGVPGLVLKWPNDLVSTLGPPGASEDLGVLATVQRRKLAGILVEREQVSERDVLLVGIGLNIGVTTEGGEAPEPAGPPSHPDRVDLHELLRAASDGDVDVSVDRGGLLAALISALSVRLGSIGADRELLIADYRQRCETIGRDVAVDLPDGDSLHGRVVDVDDDGHLVVDVDGTEHVIVAATVR
jgi:BirA family transcriptional regulator, biotin operon repressor / biotin---[acetyl-CoA-carboxylase] ligase